MKILHPKGYLLLFKGGQNYDERVLS